MKSNTRNWIRWAFILTMVGCVLSIVLIAVAMFYYPGGTESNHDTVGYSLSNYLSDLGRQTAFSGDSNTISRLLFGIAGWSFGLLLCLGFAALPSLFSKARSARRLAIIGSIFGIIGAVSYGIALVMPWDTHPLPHDIFGTLFGIAFFFELVLYCAAIFRNELYSNAYAYILLAVAIMLVLFGILSLVGEGVETAWGDWLHGTVDVVGLIAWTIGFFVQAYGGLRVEKRLWDLGPEAMLRMG